MEDQLGGAGPRVVGILYALAKLGPVVDLTGWRWNGAERSLLHIARKR